MKKVLLVAFCAVGFIMISCKKDRTCSCDVTTSGIVTTSGTYDTTFVDVSKSEAKEKCDDLDGTVSVFGQTVTTECELD